MADTQWNIEYLLATAVAYMRDVGMPNEADAIIELQRRAATQPADAALDDEITDATLLKAYTTANNGEVLSHSWRPIFLRYARIGIAAALRARAVPEGFVMVPVEPTEEMLSVAVDNWSGYEEESGRFYTPLDSDIRILWNVMLAASQSATGGAE